MSLLVVLSGVIFAVAPAAAEAKICGRTYVPARQLKAKVRLVAGPDSCGAAKQLSPQRSRPRPHTTGPDEPNARGDLDRLRVELRDRACRFADVLHSRGARSRWLLPHRRRLDLLTILVF